MTTYLTRAEFHKIKDLKTLDLEICAYGHINILNLGGQVWGKWFCRKCEREHVLCPNWCLKVARNILGCELVREIIKPSEEPVQPNKPYDLANCYLCSRELAGASKKGVIKNRNNPSFWGLTIAYQILCLACLKKRYFWRLGRERRKMLNKYLKRGYV